MQISVQSANMVTRLFSSKSSSSSSSSQKSSKQASGGAPPPPPPQSHKPKLPFTANVGKPPRKRPTNLPLSQASSQVTNAAKPPHILPPQRQSSHPPYSSKTPPPSTFRQTQPFVGPPDFLANGAGGCRTSQVMDNNSTYTSFNEDGPTYNYLDLARTRSDESLLWTAEEEASALVAELRASLTCNNTTNSDNNLSRVGRHSTIEIIQDSSTKSTLNPYQYRPEYISCSRQNSKGFNSNSGQVYNPPIAPQVGTATRFPPLQQQQNPFQRSLSVHKRDSDARNAAQKLNGSPPFRSHSFTDLQSAGVEMVPLAGSGSHLDEGSQPSCLGSSNSGGHIVHRSRLGSTGGLSVSGSNIKINGSYDKNVEKPNSGFGPPLRNFGGSWKSLLRGKF